MGVLVNGAVKLKRHQQLGAALLSPPTVLSDYARTARESVENPALRTASLVESAKRFQDLPVDLRQPQFKESRSERENMRKLLEQL